MAKAQRRTAQSYQQKAKSKPRRTKRNPLSVKHRPAASRQHGRAESRDALDYFHLSQLVIRLLGSPLPNPSPDAAYLFQELDQNVESVVGAAVRLHAQAPTTKLFLLDVDNNKLGVPISSNYGATALLQEKLQSAGIRRDTIVLGSFDHSGMINTLIEARTVVQHAKAHGWQSLAVLAPAFHLPRSAMTMASEALRQYPDLRLHPFVGNGLPWQEKAQHSQGMLGVRSDFIKSELERIARYTISGDIEPWTRLEDFFTRCDLENKGVNTQ